MTGALRPLRPTGQRLGSSPWSAGGRGLERLIFFSDAVFAIAITLLALDVRLPTLPSPLTDAGLVDALRSIVPQVAAFAISFVVIAAFWVGHFRTFRVIRGLNGRLILLNFAFLFFVVLLPFPTSVVAQAGDHAAAAILYAVFGLAIGGLSALLWVYPVRVAGLADPSIDATLGRRITYRTLVIPAVFAISIPVAMASPIAAELLWVLAAPIQGIVSRRLTLSAPLAASLSDLPLAADPEAPSA
jgi:uncharacterized membrane protein